MGITLGAVADAQCTGNCIEKQTPVGKDVGSGLGALIGAVIGAALPASGWREVYRAKSTYRFTFSDSGVPNDMETMKNKEIASSDPRTRFAFRSRLGTYPQGNMLTMPSMTFLYCCVLQSPA